jgi:hypothetical protein
MTTNPFAGAAYEAGVNQSTVEGTITQGSSTASTVIGAAQAAVPVGGVGSLGDLTDIKKLVNKDLLSGLTTDLKGIGAKLQDLGAKFKNSDAAKKLLENIEIPNAGKYTAAFSSLKDMVTQHTPTLEGLTGTGSGPLGLPSMSDFTQAVSGGPVIDNLNSALSQGGAALTSAFSGVNDMVSQSSALFAKAGVDLDAAIKPPTLGSLMSAATSLHKIGAENNGMNAVDVLKNMIPSGVNADKFGDSIKVALAEGKNKLLMAANGIKMPQFNPFDGLPSAPDNIASEDAARLLGG